MLEDFISWLKTKPPKEHYDWYSHSTCLFAQYFATQGEELSQQRGYPLELTDMEYHEIGAGGEYNGKGDDLPSAWTFGAALERAQKVHAQQTEMPHAQ